MPVFGNIINLFLNLFFFSDFNFSDRGLGHNVIQQIKKVSPCE